VSEVDGAAWAQLRIERQAWLACRKIAEKKTRSWFDVVGRIALAGQGARSSGLGVDVVNANRRARLAALQFAASDLVPRLSDEERARLQADRVLPAWFVPAMVKQAKVVERELR
jgi:hypothetical protein